MSTQLFYRSYLGKRLVQHGGNLLIAYIIESVPLSPKPSSHLFRVTLITWVGVLVTSLLVPRPALSQNQPTPTSKDTIPNNSEKLGFSGIVVSPDGQRLITPTGTVTSTTGFTPKPDGTFAAQDGTTVTPHGLIISADRRQIRTPTGTVTSSNGFTSNPDGSFTLSSGITITPSGLIISADHRRISTPNGPVTSNLGFIANPDGSFTAPDGPTVTASGIVMKPSSQGTVPEARFVSPSGSVNLSDGKTGPSDVPDVSIVSPSELVHLNGSGAKVPDTTPSVRVVGPSYGTVIKSSN